VWRELVVEDLVFRTAVDNRVAGTWRCFVPEDSWQLGNDSRA